MDKCNAQPSVIPKVNISNLSDKGKQDVIPSNIRYQKYKNKRETNIKDGKRPNNKSVVNFGDKRIRQKCPGAVAANSWFGELMEDNLDGKKPYGGSKKHNLNHLLNFSFTSREAEASKKHNYNGKSIIKSNQRIQRFCKEQFIQANCQFVVKLGNDYSIHAFDPDLSVDWNSIEEIRFNSLTSETVCPICLDTPIAAKMTKCGHIYCWACILHYMSLSDHKWRKCPICFDAIRSDDLKSVSSLAKIDFKVGDEIPLCLMKRKKGCIIATPKNCQDNNNDVYKFKHLDDNLSNNCFQKILVASSKQVLHDIIDRERNQLVYKINEEKDQPEVCFLENALQLLDEREKSLLENEGQLNDLENVNVHDVEKSDNEKDSPKEEYYYFYQAEDGQHIYLHSLNVRMLCREYGSLEYCPLKIKAKIVGMEWDSMSDQLRKRLRYLQHLPLTCEFRIVELMMEAPLLSIETINEFTNEVSARRKIRNKKEREEQKRERFIQVEENKKIYGIYPLPKYQLNNTKQFPSCHVNKEGSILTEDSTDGSTEELNDAIERNSLDNSVNSFGTSPNEFPSFATMLREGKAKPQPIKPIKPTASSSTVTQSNNSNNSDDEYHVPQYHYSLCDAFEAALELKSSNKSDEKASNGKKKKGKNKPKLLFSTGMRGN